MAMIVIDGARGEGGGQVLRTALALSLVTGQIFRIDNIRAGRARPGLLRQHLTCVNAAVEIGGAEALGAHLGSTSLTFRPGSVRPGSYRFAVGSAGSVGLVLQSVLPALLVTPGAFQLDIEGGTHADSAPPFEFLASAFVPALRRMGASIDIELLRFGFFHGGGCQETLSPWPACTCNGIRHRPPTSSLPGELPRVGVSRPGERARPRDRQARLSGFGHLVEHDFWRPRRLAS
jgi:RNA 3'-terminal phosphate cyclase (ATP)